MAFLVAISRTFAPHFQRLIAMLILHITIWRVFIKWSWPCHLQHRVSTLSPATVKESQLASTLLCDGYNWQLWSLLMGNSAWFAYYTEHHRERPTFCASLTTERSSPLDFFVTSSALGSPLLWGLQIPQLATDLNISCLKLLLKHSWHHPQSILYNISICKFWKGQKYLFKSPLEGVCELFHVILLLVTSQWLTLPNRRAFVLNFPSCLHF